MPGSGRSRAAACSVAVFAAWSALAFAFACAGTTPPTERPETGFDSGRSVVPVDPELDLPRAAPSAGATSGLVVLTAPPDPRPVRSTVAAFFDAVVTESNAGLEKVVDAAARTRASTKARPDPALAWWRRRFDVLDYTPLASEVFFFPSAVEIHTARDVPDQSGAAALPAVPRGEEVVVRVPIVGRNAAKLFGNEIVFLLKPVANRPSNYTIAELYEDFRIP